VKLVGRVARKEIEARGFVRLRYPPYDVLVALVGGEPVALEDACNHAGASLCDGDRDGDCVVCPMHAYVFELRTGRLVAPEGLCEDQRTFRATLEGDDVVVWDPIEIAIVGL
jgi:nitrite reductase/ring-hydroxylating ferredoxin subunit